MKTCQAPITLECSDYRLRVDIDQGGTWLSFDWRQPDGKWLALVEPLEGETSAFNAGCFIMAPFANRLADGKFLYCDELVEFPLNEHAAQNAIHGFSRLSQGEITMQTDHTLTCIYPVRDKRNGYIYDLIQTLSLNESGLACEIEIVHHGNKPRPYGIGIHPWFVRTPETQLSFTAECSFGRDERGLVTQPEKISSHWDFTGAVKLSDLPWFDAHYSGWHQQKAQLLRSEDAVCITISASGALKNLQIYVPDTRNVVCIEPVSHVPNVHRQRHLASFGDWSVLSVGQILSGGMHIGVEAL